MARLDTERQAQLEPERIALAKKRIQELGYEITLETSTMICFEFNGKRVQFFPYSGWHTGASITDGRGLNNLLKQIRV